MIAMVWPAKPFGSDSRPEELMANASVETFADDQVIFRENVSGTKSNRWGHWLKFERYMDLPWWEGRDSCLEGTVFVMRTYMFKNMRCQVVRLTPQRTHHLNESGTKTPFKRQIMGNPTIIWPWPRMMWTDCILFKLVKLQFAYLALVGNCWETDSSGRWMFLVAGSWSWQWWTMEVIVMYLLESQYNPIYIICIYHVLFIFNESFLICIILMERNCGATDIGPKEWFNYCFP